MSSITDLKVLNKVAQQSEEQILAGEIGVADEASDGENESDEQEDDDDDFEYDIERYVPFDDKMALAEKLKVADKMYPKECLTEIIKRIMDS